MNILEKLPFSMPSPADPAKRCRARRVRLVAWIVLLAALIGPAVQFQISTHKILSKQARLEQARQSASKTDQSPQEPLKTHKGAMWRWRLAISRFWDGANIYKADPAPGEVGLHPNAPATVVFLTSFALLPVEWMAASMNAAKLAVVLLSIFASASLARHRQSRAPDWVVGLALLLGLQMVVSDIQHGNTNIFVLGAIVLHLWLFRRGRDIPAGMVLAVAIALKMTPAFFLLYWLYQRQWRLLAGLLVGLVIIFAAVPVAAVGPERAIELTATWGRNLIAPGLVRGDWYPIHINQSLPGILGRYFLEGPSGDIFWSPDDNLYSAQKEHGWITLVALDPAAVKLLLRICQLAIVALMAWAIGWRRLPRDDGRRALHYGLVLVGMMLLNQRTWAHHAAVLVPAHVAAVQAIASGRLSRSVRTIAICLLIAAGSVVWFTPGEMFNLVGTLTGHGKQTGNYWGDLVNAYGTTFYHFLFLLTVLLVMTKVLRKQAEPYLYAGDDAGMIGTSTRCKGVSHPAGLT